MLPALGGILVAAGCAAGAPETPGPDLPGADTASGAPRASGDNAGSWAVGPVETCAAPVPLGWTDRSDLFWDGLDYPGHADDGACVALEHRGDAWRIWASGWDDGVAGSLHQYDLATGAATHFSVPHLSQRLMVDDLDGDGEDDVASLLLNGWLLWGGTTEGVLLDAMQVSYSYSPLDLDGDGLRDLVVLGVGDDGEHPPAPQLVANLGDRRLGAPLAAPSGPVGMVFASQVLDWDGDGDPDVFHCNDFGSIEGGNGVLVDEDGALVAGDARGADIVANCMSVSFGDIDSDGALDMYVAQNGPQRLLLDTGDFGFVDVGAARISEPYTGGQMAWSGVVVDADNDARTDILVSTSDFSRGELGAWPVWWLRQEEDGRFVESGADVGLPQDTSARGLTARDINGDGVVDLLVADVRRPPYLLLSDGCTEAAWVEVDAPTGSRVTVEAGGRTTVALVSRQDGWCGWGPPTAHIGLGNVETIDRITVEAPWQPAGWIEAVPARTRLVWTPD